MKYAWEKHQNRKIAKIRNKKLSAPPAGGGPGAQGARGRLQVGQKVQRLQHK